MAWKTTDMLNLTADYICTRAFAADGRMSVLKLHKLLYYVQAWNLAFYGKRFMPEVEFEAWVHGPASRELYKRFAGEKLMYSDVTESDLRFKGDDFSMLGRVEQAHIENVLDIYLKFTGPQLETLTHEEEPWKIARGNLSPFEKCSNVIADEHMRVFYRKLAGISA